MLDPVQWLWFPQIAIDIALVFGLMWHSHPILYRKWKGHR